MRIRATIVFAVGFCFFTSPRLSSESMKPAVD